MTTKSITLSVLGVGAVGGIAGAGAMIYSPTQPKTIRELLLKEQIALLDTEGGTSDENWKTLATKHKETSVVVDRKTIAKIDQLVITDLEGNQGVNFSLLKAKCKSLLNEPTTNKELAKLKDNAINWCSTKSPILPQTGTNLVKGRA